MSLTFDTIAQDERRTGRCHHTDDIVGYVVVLTKIGHGRVRDVALYDDPALYGEVVELAQEIRAAYRDTDNYARIDVLYSDGARGIL